MPMTGLVNFLSGSAKQPVMDSTGLKGAFDIAIDLTPERDPLPATAAGGAPSNPGSTFPRLSAAVEEQLGLRLEPRKTPVETLIIDHVERPSEN